MRYCPSCKAKVSYPFAYCPLCQNELYVKRKKNELEDNLDLDEFEEEFEEDTSENVNEDGVQTDEKDELRYYPEIKSIRNISFADKLQQFLILIILVNCTFFDYVFGLHGKVHWSILCLIWGVCLEFNIRPIFKRRFVPASFTTRMAIMVSISFLLTAGYMGFMRLCVDWIIPIIILVTLCLNAIYFIVGKSGEQVVYALCVLFLGIVPELIMFLIFHEVAIMWKVCLITCITSFLGMVFFMGAKVNTEIHKQLNL